MTPARTTADHRINEYLLIPSANRAITFNDDGRQIVIGVHLDPKDAAELAHHLGNVDQTGG